MLNQVLVLCMTSILSYLCIFRSHTMQNWLINNERTEKAKMEASDFDTIYRIKFIGVGAAAMSLVNLYAMLKKYEVI
ncbi:hypothetical protein [Leptospira saintgironsiae]|uniref:Uncharacterized protein n=1 Tax=Leptospira saintgironsiae TaxID=2023183 RepID=A0A2M9Y996_9LEPT|nr:hypothetical protein [Leptospira saintgironsiae]PJZ48150.1 hypothetical protein CH362_15270 [Leptospira saintgironsiae]